MATAKKCDICGCLISKHLPEPFGDRGTGNLVGVRFLYDRQKHLGYRADYFNLCYSCALELIEYLNSKKRRK